MKFSSTAIERFNSEKTEAEDRVALKGFGIHHGDLLIIPNSNVHWGDPVNTASKLGEDIADDMDVLISIEAHRLLQLGPRGSDGEAVNITQFASLPFEKRSHTVSRVDLTCFALPLLIKQSSNDPVS
eukprot:TRINITY_DN7014_c0_g1_i3.p1 TRINITY_DN7014_c0_g1~~TRINITY_DN7014_c0_g1_i3.p1  ORF type:complete len:127 (-),score=22.74 TRINITY_DN7014_c0_g1_i3:12-392(-)